jgi:hypothetical protein
MTQVKRTTSCDGEGDEDSDFFMRRPKRRLFLEEVGAGGGVILG